MYKRQWFDTAQEGIAAAEQIEIERNKIYDTRKMLELHMQYTKSIMEKQMRGQIKEKMEEETSEPEKKILWN